MVAAERSDPALKIWQSPLMDLNADSHEISDRRSSEYNPHHQLLCPHAQLSFLGPESILRMPLQERLHPFGPSDGVREELHGLDQSLVGLGTTEA